MSYSLVINEKSIHRFYPSRGIRQGDPLSPFFLFVVDVLSKMIQKRAQTKVINELKIERYCPILTHLFFADDYCSF